jgi:hypothetical protein
MVVKIKLSYRKKIWIYSAILTLCSLMLTYSFQFFTFPLQIFPQYQANIRIEILQKLLFIVGISTQSPFSLWRQIYFYFFMVILNCI